MQIISGTYAGTGSAQSISGLGFQPDAVLIKGGANIGAIVLSSMPANNTKPMSGATALFAGGVTSIDADGFTLGTDARVNAAATTYFYVALRDNGADDLAVGTYTGDNLDNRDIGGVGFQPDSVLICSASTHIVFWCTSDMVVGESLNIGSGTVATDRIQALQPDGFQVGTGSDVNQNTIVYTYLAIKNSAIFKALTYAGTGVDNRSVTGAGFQPENVLTKHATVATAAAIRFKDQVGDSSFQVNAVAAAANKIQAFEADGFQVGTHQTVNENLMTYYAWAMKDGVTSGGGATASLTRVANASSVSAGTWASGITEVLPPPSVTVPSTGQVLTIVRG